METPTWFDPVVPHSCRTFTYFVPIWGVGVYLVPQIICNRMVFFCKSSMVHHGLLIFGADIKWYVDTTRFQAHIEAIKLMISLSVFVSYIDWTIYISNSLVTNIYWMISHQKPLVTRTTFFDLRLSEIHHDSSCLADARTANPSHPKAGSWDFLCVIARVEMLAIVFNVFNIVWCSQCSLWQSNPGNGTVPVLFDAYPMLSRCLDAVWPRLRFLIWIGSGSRVIEE